MTDQPYFCAAPWVHLHAQANGDLLPCCIANTSLPVGNLKTQTIEEAWHGEAMVKLRANMLSGKPSAECTYCYHVEQSGGHSPRHNFNRVFGPSLASQLPLDAAPPLRLSYIDFRFSNLCNFKCRTCGPHASSAWMEDWRDLWELPQPLEAVTPLKPGQSWAALIEPHLDHVEEVYFAGGEPLIMPEHYWFLQELISRKRTQVRLRYNTNFTFLAHKHGDAVDLWRHFDDVFVGASIDAAGSRGEYLRKGLRWRQILENRRRLRAEAPHVSFKVSAVVGLMNAFAVADMHREMVEGGFIAPDEFQVHILDNPVYLSTQLLSGEWKARVQAHLAAHIDWLAAFSGTESVRRGFQSITTHMNAQDTGHLLPEFKRFTDRLDTIRGESFCATFPEFSGLL